MNPTPINDKRAQTGFILGLVSIVAWILPLIGLPISVLAIVFSSLGLSSSKRQRAIAGLTLGVIFLTLTLINSIAGAVIYAQKYKNAQTPAPAPVTEQTTK